MTFQDKNALKTVPQLREHFENIDKFLGGVVKQYEEKPQDSGPEGVSVDGALAEFVMRRGERFEKDVSDQFNVIVEVLLASELSPPDDIQL